MHASTAKAAKLRRLVGSGGRAATMVAGTLTTIPTAVARTIDLCIDIPDLRELGKLRNACCR